MYRWVDHTAEIELLIEADRPEAVYADAASAVGELVGPAAEDEPVARPIALAASDRASLLAAFVDELVFLVETEGLVPEGVADVHLEDARLDAEVRGRRGRPAHLIKGATLHRLAFDCDAGGCRATVVLDV
jgi:SHS2 domain-containing protein